MMLTGVLFSLLLAAHLIGEAKRKSRIEQLVVQRTAELEQSNVFLCEAKEAAEASNRAKTNFLNVISHELRTPLTIVLGNLQELSDRHIVELMVRAKLDPEKVACLLDSSGSLSKKQLAAQLQTLIDVDTEQARDLAADALVDAQHLLTLINDILDFSKIEAGKIELVPMQMQACLVVEPVVASMKILADKKQLDLVCDVPRSLMVHADVVRFKQVLLNLLGNAIKFTQQGTIRLSAVSDDQYAVFSISDTGCGIPKSSLSDIFKIFTQVDDSSTRTSVGTGLGLPICEQLLKLQGGDIWVESELGQGSCFWFSLPMVANDSENADVVFTAGFDQPAI